MGGFFMKWTALVLLVFVSASTTQGKAQVDVTVTLDAKASEHLYGKLNVPVVTTSIPNEGGSSSIETKSIPEAGMECSHHTDHNPFINPVASESWTCRLTYSAHSP
jgi:hypothetical protein